MSESPSEKFPKEEKRAPAVRDFSHAWRALRHRNFRLFFGGQSISLIGTWMTRIATAWLVYRLTKSALLLGTVSFVGQIPTFLLAPFAGNELTFDRETEEYFHPGRSARALVDGVLVAQFGQIADAVKTQRKLRQDVFLAEIYLERLHQFGLRKIKFEPLAKYPAVERDFSFVFSDDVEFDAMRRAVMGLRIPDWRDLLREFKPVEIFRGGSIAPRRADAGGMA